MGSFDPVLLREALIAITLGALKLRSQRDNAEPIRIQLRKECPSAQTVDVSWQGAGFSTAELLASLSGIAGVRMALATKIVSAHGGTIAGRFESVCVTLPLRGEGGEAKDRKDNHE